MPSKNKASEYAENLSHELLTPLAVIRTKAELLLQSPNLKSEDLKSLDVILKSVGRMNSLNKSLILLSKIDNEVYEDRSEVNIFTTCEDALENYEDQIRAKNLKIRLSNSNEVKLLSNATLIDILINNLLKNAVTHNIVDGEIHIKIENRQLIITNTFDLNFPPPEQQFNRFETSRSDSGSLGLGLSIVQSIVNFLKLELKAEQSQNQYTTIISF